MGARVRSSFRAADRMRAISGSIPWNDPFRTPRSRWMTTGTGTAKPERAPVDDNPSLIGLGTCMVMQAPPHP